MMRHWIYAKDLAAELDLTRQSASQIIKRIPGAELLYTHARGERWRVSREAYDAWRASQKSASDFQT